MIHTSRFNFFNSVCLCFSALFIFGIIWVWRGAAVNAMAQVEQAAPAVATEVTPHTSRVSSSSKSNILTLKNTDIEEESVSAPKQMHLSVPFTSQAPEADWDQPWQDACEEAAVLMLDAFYRGQHLSPLFAKDELLKMIDWETENGWHTSIPLEKIQILAEHYTGKSFQVVGDPGVDEIKSFLISGHPVLVVAHGQSLPNPHFSGDGPLYHALVITGYTQTTFITNDPGTRRGEEFEYTFDDLLSAVHDWNGGDVENGESVVLVAA
jgi:hypothetical protein